VGRMGVQGDAVDATAKHHMAHRLISSERWPHMHIPRRLGWGRGSKSARGRATTAAMSEEGTAETTAAPAEPAGSATGEAGEAAEVVAEVGSEDDDWVEEGNRPRCGYTTRAFDSVRLLDGTGTNFNVRTGPNYKKTGNKVPSQAHLYHPVSIDVLRRDEILMHAASHLTLPPPPDGKLSANTCGLPRRLVINMIFPQDGPSLFSSPTDGPCYQMIVTLAASDEALSRWKAEGSPAVRLWERFATSAPEGVLPDSGDLDVKERVKVIPIVENVKTAGLPSWLESYNGKPALITKSGAVFHGDDYIEICMNTFRFGLFARKGLNYLLPRFAEFQLHCAVTLEGREDHELDECVLCAARLQGMDIEGMAQQWGVGAAPTA